MAKSKVAKGKSLFSFFIPALAIGTLLVLLAAVAFFYLGYQQPLKDQASFYLQSAADDKAEEVNRNIQQIQAAIEKTTNNYTDERTILKELKSVFPEVQSVNTYVETDLVVNTKATPIVTHITLELLKKGLAGEKVKPELVLNGSKAEYVAFISYAREKLYLITIDPRQMSRLFGSV